MLTLEHFLPRQRGGDPRAWMNKPFSIGDGYVYATDGYIAARRPTTEKDIAAGVQLLGDDHKVKHTLPGLFATALNSSAQVPCPTIQAAPCKQCATRGLNLEKPCTNCEGSGEFERDGYDYECKTCDATGWMDANLTDKHARTNWCYLCGGTGYEIEPHASRKIDFTAHGANCFVVLSERHLLRITGATLYLHHQQATGFKVRHLQGVLLPATHYTSL